MKNTIFLAITALFFSAAVNAQSTVDSIAAKYKLLPMPEPLTIEKTFPILGAYTLNNAPATSANAASSTTADDSAASTSAAATATTPNLTVTMDSASKGIVWIEGLPQGRIKAYLRKSPATYRILSQKTENGTQIQEGTAILDTATKTLNIALGAPYNEADPAAVFALSGAAETDSATGESKVEVKTKTKTSKTKNKVTFYTATKVQPATIVDDQEVQDQHQQNQDEKKEDDKHQEEKQ